MKLLMNGIEWLNIWIGKVMGWLMLALVLLVTIDVISRWFYNTGHPIIQETEWWMFSIIFLMCAGYTFVYNEHVRVDIIYSRLDKKWQNIVDLICAFIFLFPMCLLLILTSTWYIRDSWQVREISPDPGGLCCYYILKSFIPIGFFFLGLQGIVNVYRIIQELRGGEPVALPADSFLNRAHEATTGKTE